MVWIGARTQPAEPPGLYVSCAGVASQLVHRLREHIASQQEHHRHVSFHEEYLAPLSRHGVNFDERGVFG